MKFINKENLYRQILIPFYSFFFPKNRNFVFVLAGSDINSISQLFRLITEGNETQKERIFY